MSKQKLIMIVDDEKTVRDVLSAFLKLKGFKTVAIEDWQTAILYTGIKTPDLVLLDIKMPGLDGIKTCLMLNHALRFNQVMCPSPRTGIFIITAHDTPENTKKSFSAGAIDVIRKPFDFDDINYRINTWFEVRDLEDESERYKLFTEKVNWYSGRGLSR